MGVGTGLGSTYLCLLRQLRKQGSLMPATTFSACQLCPGLQCHATAYDSCARNGKPSIQFMLICVSFEASQTTKANITGGAQVQTSRIQRTALLDLLQEHLTNNVVTCQGTFMCQTQGIPQACCLGIQHMCDTSDGGTSMLCSLAAEMTKNRQTLA